MLTEGISIVNYDFALPLLESDRG